MAFSQYVCDHLICSIRQEKKEQEENLKRRKDTKIITNSSYTHKLITTHLFHQLFFCIFFLLFFFTSTVLRVFFSCSVVSRQFSVSAPSVLWCDFLFLFVLFIFCPPFFSRLANYFVCDWNNRFLIITIKIFEIHLAGVVCITNSHVLNSLFAV